MFPRIVWYKVFFWIAIKPWQSHDENWSLEKTYHTKLRELRNIDTKENERMAFCDCGDFSGCKVIETCAFYCR